MHSRSPRRRFDNNNPPSKRSSLFSKTLPLENHCCCYLRFIIHAIHAIHALNDHSRLQRSTRRLSSLSLPVTLCPVRLACPIRFSELRPISPSTSYPTWHWHDLAKQSTTFFSCELESISVNHQFILWQLALAGRFAQVNANTPPNHRRRVYLSSLEKSLALLDSATPPIHPRRPPTDCYAHFSVEFDFELELIIVSWLLHRQMSWVYTIG